MNDENRRRQIEGTGRRLEAVQLYTDGESTAEIAERLNLARGTVNRYLREARAESSARSLDLIEDWRGRGLAIAEAVIASQWVGMVEGDPRAAMVVLRATEHACRLLGADKIRPAPDFSSEEIQTIVSEATPAEREALRGGGAEALEVARRVLGRVGV